MAGNKNYVKITTPIRTIRSEIGQVKISLFNDQVSLSFQPATNQKTEYGGIKYNGSPQVAPNIRFSVGVAAAIGKLLRDTIIPAADAKQNGHWEVFACKRNAYEAYLGFDVQGNNIVMTGTEITNGMRKQASYNFPPTIISDGSGNSVNIHGEALATAELMCDLGGNNEMSTHMRQYNQALKDNMPEYNQNHTINNATPTVGNAQSMGSWYPHQ